MSACACGFVMNASSFSGGTQARLLFNPESLLQTFRVQRVLPLYLSFYIVFIVGRVSIQFVSFV